MGDIRGMGEIHPVAVGGYTARADTYVHGRPEYPPEIEEWLRKDLGLGAGKRALDLGAGTGKFSKRLLAAGADVIAVEPVPAMLQRLNALIEQYPGFIAKQGSAEDIPLPDASVDAVVCAQSFHWFATAAAVREIHRVLRPGGFLGLIWNVRDESVGWVAALSGIIEPFAGDAPRYWKQDWRKIFSASGLNAGFSALRERHFPNGHSGPSEQVIVNRILSVSFIAALPRDEQKLMEDEVRALIAATPELAGRETVTFPYETATFCCTKLP